MTKQRAEVGFDDPLEDFDPDDWKTREGQEANPKTNIPKEEIRKVAEQTGFTSREGKSLKDTKDTPSRFVHRTGRDTQFNTKVRLTVKQGFYDLRQETGKPLGAILEDALEALHRELARQDPQTSLPLEKG